MFTPRPYQQQGIDKIVAFFKAPHKRHGLAIFPTGTGKSLVIADAARQLEGNTIIFQPSQEILLQNQEKLTAYGYKSTIYSASLGEKKISPITLATIGSVKGKAHLFDSFKNVIIDECHLVNAKGGMYKDFISSLEGCKVVGLTATPYRLMNGLQGSILKFLTRTNPRIFSEVIHVTQCMEIYKAGFWSPLKYYQVNGFDESRVKRNSGNDYDEDALRKYYNEIGFAERLVDVTQRLLNVKRRGLLIFTRFIKEANFLAEQVPGVVVITGSTDQANRERIIKQFKAGNIKAVVNVGVLTTGFDYPELDTVLLARPTRSLALYYQMIGRCVRPHKDKPESWVVDICDNYRRFGQVEYLNTVDTGNGKWVVRYGNKQLTNVYF